MQFPYNINKHCVVVVVNLLKKKRLFTSSYSYICVSLWSWWVSDTFFFSLIIFSSVTLVIYTHYESLTMYDELTRTIRHIFHLSRSQSLQLHQSRDFFFHWIVWPISDWKYSQRMLVANKDPFFSGFLFNYYYCVRKLLLYILLKQVLNQTVRPRLNEFFFHFPWRTVLPSLF